MTLQPPQTLIHLLLAGAAAAAVTFFAVGLTLYFERSPRPRWVITAHYSSMVLALLQVAGVFFLPPRSDPFVAAGIVMYTVAILLFLSAIEAARRTRLQRSFIDHPLPDRLITDGPYRWVRHPFGTGYLLGALAAPVGIDDLRMVLLALPLVAMTVYAAVREERVWLASGRGEDYRAYRRRTGMFVPFIGRG
ncbi:MAG: isoprenylcysteine carboxylmethyltransferase family protein [Cyanobacteria bacterium]|nr:isoprenylcysteine carboxylmethyltransferase family protein [Cyanobacteriota bacterium]